MVAPVIAAGVMAVARYIAKQGITKAIKKYGQKSVTEAKKHVKDVTKKDGGRTAEKAANIKKIKPVQAANANSRATLRKGFGVGVGIVGAGATIKVKDLKEKLKNAKTAELRAKYKAQIETEMRKLAAKEKPKKQPKPIRPKLRPPVKNSGAVQTSLRPKKRPTT